MSVMLEDTQLNFSIALEQLHVIFESVATSIVPWPMGPRSPFCMAIQNARSLTLSSKNARSLTFSSKNARSLTFSFKMLDNPFQILAQFKTNF